MATLPSTSSKSHRPEYGSGVPSTGAAIGAVAVVAQSWGEEPKLVPDGPRRLGGRRARADAEDGSAGRDPLDSALRECSDAETGTKQPESMPSLLPPVTSDPNTSSRGMLCGESRSRLLGERPCGGVIKPESLSCILTPWWRLCGLGDTEAVCRGLCCPVLDADECVPVLGFTAPPRATRHIACAAKPLEAG